MYKKLLLISVERFNSAAFCKPVKHSLVFFGYVIHVVVSDVIDIVKLWKQVPERTLPDTFIHVIEEFVTGIYGLTNRIGYIWIKRKRGIHWNTFDLAQRKFCIWNSWNPTWGYSRFLLLSLHWFLTRQRFPRFCFCLMLHFLSRLRRVMLMVSCDAAFNFEISSAHSGFQLQVVANVRTHASSYLQPERSLVKLLLQAQTEDDGAKKASKGQEGGRWISVWVQVGQIGFTCSVECRATSPLPVIAPTSVTKECVKACSMRKRQKWSGVHVLGVTALEMSLTATGDATIDSLRAPSHRRPARDSQLLLCSVTSAQSCIARFDTRAFLCQHARSRNDLANAVRGILSA